MNTPGRLVGSGRYADVYDIGHGRVLRRYRDAAALAGREAEVMTHARTHGVRRLLRSARLADRPRR